MEGKSLTQLFPVGGGHAVDTNDCCIVGVILIQNFKTLLWCTYHNWNDSADFTLVFTEKKKERNKYIIV